MKSLHLLGESNAILLILKTMSNNFCFHSRTFNATEYERYEIVAYVNGMFVGLTVAYTIKLVKIDNLGDFLIKGVFFIVTVLINNLKCQDRKLDTAKL